MTALMAVTATVEVPLTQGLVAVVDAADYDLVRPYVWCAARAGTLIYAMRNPSPRLMHQVITGAALTDHRNGDGLDNRRANLRPATHAENMRNRRKLVASASPYKGVSPSHGRWRAFIRAGGPQLYLGSFGTDIEAAHAYDEAAREHHGAHGTFNFPRPGERSALS